MIQYDDLMEVNKENKFRFSILLTEIVYCKIFEAEFQAVLLFKTCL